MIFLILWVSLAVKICLDIRKFCLSNAFVNYLLKWKLIINVNQNVAKKMEQFKRLYKHYINIRSLGISYETFIRQTIYILKKISFYLPVIKSESSVPPGRN